MYYACMKRFFNNCPHVWSGRRCKTSQILYVFLTREMLVHLVNFEKCHSPIHSWPTQTGTVSSLGSIIWPDPSIELYIWIQNGQNQSDIEPIDVILCFHSWEGCTSMNIYTLQGMVAVGWGGVILLSLRSIIWQDPSVELYNCLWNGRCLSDIGPIEVIFCSILEECMNNI